MCVRAVHAVIMADFGDPALKSTMIALADASQPDPEGLEWKTYASVERIAHLCGRGVSTVRRDLGRLQPRWITRAGEWSGAQGKRREPRCVYTLNLAAILAARDPFFGEPTRRELVLYSGMPSALILSGGDTEERLQPALNSSADHNAEDREPALNLSTTGAQVEHDRRSSLAAANVLTRSERVSNEPSAFERLGEAWAGKAPGRFSRPKALAAFEAACSSGHDPDFLADCGVRFLAESRDAMAGRVPMLHRWLADERWRGFEPSAAVAARAGLARFDGPAEVMAILHGNSQHDWPAYLAGCVWDGDRRVLAARSGLVFREAERWLGQELAGLGVTIARAA